MDDADYYWLAGCILLLCGACMLLARRVAQIDVDVQFLMDHTVTRETIGGQTNG